MMEKENSGKVYKIYNNSNSSQMTTIERHMHTLHADDWRQACADAGVKRKPTHRVKDSHDVQNEEFTLDGMMHYLLTWIAVDDQVSLFHSWFPSLMTSSLLALWSHRNFVTSFFIVHASLVTMTFRTGRRQQKRWWSYSIN
jgi:hypothetical protein